MYVVYDAEADAAYLHLADALTAPVAKTVPAGDDVNIDFDEAGVIVGIEVLGASVRLPQAVLLSASSASDDSDES